MILTTWSPTDKHSEIILTNNNLTVNATGTSYKGVKASNQTVVDKFYFEVLIENVGDRILVGLANNTVSTASSYGTGASGIPVGVKGLMNTGIIYNGDVTVSGGTFVKGDTIGVSFDKSTGSLTIRKNNVQVYTTNLSIADNWLPYVIGYKANDSITANFGATSFKYPIPEGYKSYSVSLSVNKILLSSSASIESKAIINTPDVKHNIVMKSNTTPSPYKVIFLNQFPDLSLYAWNSFNGNLGSRWRSETTIVWIGLDFSVKTKVSKVHLAGSSYTTANPKDFRIEGSNDGVTWDSLLLVENQVNWATNEVRIFDMKKVYEYSMYRIYILSNNGFTNSSSIGQIVFSYSESYIANLSSQSEQNFIDYGMSPSDLASIDMYADFTEKHYIQDVSTVLGTGKVFEQVLDTNKLLKKTTMK